MSLAFDVRADISDEKFIDLYRRGLIPIFASREFHVSATFSSVTHSRRPLVVGLAWIWYDFGETN